MISRTHVLLWTDPTAAYLAAIKAAGPAGRVAVDSLPRKEKPSAEQIARTEVLSAALTRSATRSSRACSWRIWPVSSTAGRSGRWWTAMRDIDAK